MTNKQNGERGETEAGGKGEDGERERMGNRERETTNAI